MIKAIDGSMIFHATRPGSLPERMEYKPQTVREMSTGMLRNRLRELMGSDFQQEFPWEV